MAISKALRTAIAERASGCCEYCKSQSCYSATPFSVEHIVPCSQGGSSHFDNLALACQGCNNFKYTAVQAIDPLSGREAALFNPRSHRWSEHFQWTSDTSRLIGITPIGRATIDRLRLNREGVVNLRLALASVGEHPPGI